MIRKLAIIALSLGVLAFMFWALTRMGPPEP